MGVPCCKEVDYASIKFRGDLYKLQAFQETQMPNDPVVQQWLSQNLTTQEHEKQKQKQEKKVYRLKDSDTYFYCSWLNSLAEGKGFVYKPNTLFVSGNFKQGLPQGKALVKFLNQSYVYEGDIKGWRAHGNGVLINNKNNYKLSACWQNSKVKNAMINFFADPNISSIQIDTFEQGRGNISYKDGRWYQGLINTKKLCPHGHGKVNYPFESSKQSYDGEWYNGKMVGSGKLLYRNKQLYQGQFFNGMRQGYGKFTFLNGNFYQGYWKSGKQEGIGMLYNKLTQLTKYGIWQSGKYKKQLQKSKYLQMSQLQKSKNSKGPLQNLNQDKNLELSSSRVSQLNMKLTQSRVG